MSISNLSRKTGIALRTVENVHSILKQHGITDGAVGAKGGISLVIPLTRISLGQLVAWFDEGVEFTVCCGDKANECPQQDVCPTRSAWQAVSGRIQASLNEVLLSDILHQFSPGAGDTLAAWKIPGD